MAVVKHDAEMLVDSFVQSKKNPHSRRTYLAVLGHYARWARASGPIEAVSVLLSKAPDEALLTVTAYREGMLASQLSAATVNNRIAILRSLVGEGREMGLIGWKLGVDFAPASPQRVDPMARGVGGMLRAARRQGGLIGARDVATLRLAFDLGLGVNDISRLDVGDVSPKEGEIWVKMRKGMLKMSFLTASAMHCWMEKRGGAPDNPCFIRLPVEGTAPMRLGCREVKGLISGYAAP
jgi:integrase